MISPDNLTDGQVRAEINRHLEILGRHAGRNIMRRFITYGYDPDDLPELVSDECEVFRLGMEGADLHDLLVVEAVFRYWLIQEGKALSGLVETEGTA